MLDQAGIPGWTSSVVPEEHCFARSRSTGGQPRKAKLKSCDDHFSSFLSTAHHRWVLVERALADGFKGSSGWLETCSS